MTIITGHANGVRKTPHSFMIDALSREVERLEFRARFAADAAESEAEAMATGKSIGLDSAFDYLEGRVAGRKVRRPRPRRT